MYKIYIFISCLVFVFTGLSIWIEISKCKGEKSESGRSNEKEQ